MQMQHELDEASEQRPILLSCRSVEKYFGALAAVRSMNFDVHAGEVVGIGGPNGAGKTTLFDIVSGLNPADAGEILFSGQRIEQWKPDRICHAGLARTFQFNAAFDKLSAFENVLIGSYYGRHHRIVPNLRFDHRSKTRAQEAIELVGMEGSLDAVVENLSVFDRKRLMIASALATQPKLLLLDEPVGGLNPHEIDEVMSIVNRVRDSGVTIVLIEHVMRFLVALSDRVLIMHHGEKIYQGSTQGLAQDRTVVEVYLGDGASDRLTHILEGAPSDG
jgi:branched-chain amino acid transport system ATP-binding protein